MLLPIVHVLYTRNRYSRHQRQNIDLNTTRRTSRCPSWLVASGPQIGEEGDKTIAKAKEEEYERKGYKKAHIGDLRKIFAGKMS